MPSEWGYGLVVARHLLIYYFIRTPFHNYNGIGFLGAKPLDGFMLTQSFILLRLTNWMSETPRKPMVKIKYLLVLTLQPWGSRALSVKRLQVFFCFLILVELVNLYFFRSRILINTFLANALFPPFILGSWSTFQLVNFFVETCLFKALSIATSIAFDQLLSFHPWSEGPPQVFIWNSEVGKLVKIPSH